MYDKGLARQRANFFWDNPGATDMDYLIAQTEEGSPWARGIDPKWYVKPLTEEQIEEQFPEELEGDEPY
jgi:hypothetical protein